MDYLQYIKTLIYTPIIFNIYDNNKNNNNNTNLLFYKCVCNKL